MGNYPQERAEDAVCQEPYRFITGLWFLPDQPLGLNTTERKANSKASPANSIYTGGTCAGVKRPRRDAEYSPPFISKFKQEWSTQLLDL